MFKYVLCFEKSWGQDRCLCTAYVRTALQSQDHCSCSACGADVTLSHGNTASDQSEDGSGFRLADIYCKQ